MDKKELKAKKKLERHRLRVSRMQALLALVVNALFLYFVWSLNQYSTLSRQLFLGLNCVVLLLLLAANLFVVLGIWTKRSRVYLTCWSLLIFLFLAGSGLAVVTYQINRNIHRIVNQDQQQEVLGISFVMLDQQGDQKTIKPSTMEGKKVGILNDPNSQQGHVLPKKELEKLKIGVTYQEYSDYTAIAKALVKQEIDVAAMVANYTGFFETNEEIAPYLTQMKTVHTFNAEVHINLEQGSNKDLTKEPFTVLLMGIDEERSDAIMLASFNPLSMQATLTSIPRDSYIPISCYKNKTEDKLTHAHARGRQCSIDTVEELLDVPIDFYFESNFQGIIDMVDALGGIIVDSPVEFTGQTAQAERGHKTVWVPKGVNRLSGIQALAFARERYAFESGDFQRQSNQQQVINAILSETVKIRDVNKALKILDAAGENVSTNLSIDQLISLFQFSLKKLDRSYVKNQYIFNLVGSRVTGYSSRNNGASIVRLFPQSIEDNKKFIQRNLQLDTSFDGTKTTKFNMNWVYEAPEISREYDIPTHNTTSDVKDPVPNFIGKSVSKAESWTDERKIELQVIQVKKGDDLYDASSTNNTIIKQSVRSGKEGKNLDKLTVYVIQISNEDQKTPDQEETTKTEVQCTKNATYDSKKKECICDAGFVEQDNGACKVVQ